MWLSAGWSESTEYQLPTKRGAVVYSRDSGIQYQLTRGGHWLAESGVIYTFIQLHERYPDLVTKFEGFDA